MRYTYEQGLVKRHLGYEELFHSSTVLARLRLRPTSPEVAPIGHQKNYTSVIADNAAGG
jgi:hypothetical protein